MSHVLDLGAKEDRTREQFTAEILHHPPGEPGHVYVANVIARARANTIEELAQMLVQSKKER